MFIKLMQYYSNGRFNQHLEQVLQSSRYCSSHGLFATIKIVNLILAEEHKLKNYSLLVLIKITKLILSEKYTLKSIVQNFKTFSAKMILHFLIEQLISSVLGTGFSKPYNTKSNKYMHRGNQISLSLGIQGDQIYF